MRQIPTAVPDGTVVQFPSATRQALAWNASAIDTALDILTEFEWALSEQIAPQHEAMEWAAPDDATFAVAITPARQESLARAIRVLLDALAQAERTLGGPVNPPDPSSAMSA